MLQVRHNDQIYEVYDTGKPAILKDSFVWGKYQFDTLEDATRYAEEWLGLYWDRKRIQPDTKHFYHEDCYVEVRTVDNDEIITS